MDYDRGHYVIDSEINVGIELGSQICTETELSQNQFTYNGFTFVSTDSGHSWQTNNTIEYAVAPPLRLRKGADDRLYICYQNGNLAVIKVNDSTTLILSVDDPINQFSASSDNASGFNVGEPMIDLGGEMDSFDYEFYYFEPFSDGTKWEVSPSVTE